MSSMYHDRLRNLYTFESAKVDNQTGQPRYGLVETYDPATHRSKASILPDRRDDGSKINTVDLHLASTWVGKGWGDVAPLPVNCQLLLVPVYGSDSEYVIVGSHFNKTDTPAKGPNDIDGEDKTVEVGERLLRSKSGTTVKFVNDNTLMIKSENFKGQCVHIITKGTDVHITASDFVHVDCKTAEVNASESILAKAGTTITGQAGSKITLTAPEIEINGHVTINGDTDENGSFHATGQVEDYGSTMGTIRGFYDVHVHDDSDPPTPQLPA